MTNEKIVEKLKQTDLTKYQNLSDLFDMARTMEDYDLNGEVWRLAAKVAKEKGDLEFYDLYKRSLLFAAPHRFDEYMLYLEFNRDPDKKFYVPRRSVLKPVVDALQDLEDDKVATRARAWIEILRTVSPITLLRSQLARVRGLKSQPL